MSDRRQQPSVDPSENVKSLNEAAQRRQDDLRTETGKRYDAEIKHLKEMAKLRSTHAKELRELERDRLEKIRQVDVTAVKTEADRALAAIQTLAATTATNAETLRNALTNTATTIAKQTSDTVGQLIERIAALEKSSYEGQGRSTVSDPALVELTKQVQAVVTLQQTGTGKSAGITATWVVILGAVSLLGGLLAIYAALKP